MFLLNLVQVFALQGPPAVVSPLGRTLSRHTTDTTLKALLHWCQSRCYRRADLDHELFVARSSSPWPHHRLCIRYLPSTKDHLGVDMHYLFHRLCHRSWGPVDWQTNRCPDAHWLRLRRSASSILRTQRDPPSKVETSRARCYEHRSFTGCDLWTAHHRCSKTL